MQNGLLGTRSAVAMRGDWHCIHHIHHAVQATGCNVWRNLAVKSSWTTGSDKNPGSFRYPLHLMLPLVPLASEGDFVDRPRQLPTQNFQQAVIAIGNSTPRIDLFLLPSALRAYTRRLRQYQTCPGQPFRTSAPSFANNFTK
jgi:hypothetical protein